MIIDIMPFRASFKGDGTDKWTVFYSDMGLKETFPSFEFAARRAKEMVRYDPSIRSSCVHIIDPDGAPIDYDTVCFIAEEFDWWKPY